MQSQPAPFSILSAPLPNCDRRALSEAWYSALHMHRDSAAPPKLAHAVPALAREGAPVHRPGRYSSGAVHAAPSLAVRVGAAPALAGAPPVERRAIRSKLAQDIERIFLRTPHPPRHASFSLGAGRGRVQILLRERGTGMQIVALCPPAAREIVAQALAQARYTLALRGIALQADVRGFAR